jgi:hypothetical protein
MFSKESLPVKSLEKQCRLEQLNNRPSSVIKYGKEFFPENSHLPLNMVGYIRRAG